MLGDKTTLTDFTTASASDSDLSRSHAIASDMQINPDIFKAYDIRGLYPGEINEDGRAADRPRLRRVSEGADRSASRATCACRRRRSPRRSSKARATQGADVVDYGMLGTDMLYFAVVQRRARRRRADHGVAQSRGSTTASRWCARARCRSAATPGIGDIRDMIANDRAAAAGGDARHASPRATVLAEYVEKVMSFIDPSVIKPFNVVLDAGSGMAGLVAPPLFDRLPCKVDEALLRDRRHLPEPRGQPAHRGEPPRHHRAK